MLIKVLTECLTKSRRVKLSVSPILSIDPDSDIDALVSITQSTAHGFRLASLGGITDKCNKPDSGPSLIVPIYNSRFSSYTDSKAGSN